jgi:hypothetical protein
MISPVLSYNPLLLGQHNSGNLPTSQVTTYAEINAEKHAPMSAKIFRSNMAVPSKSAEDL